ncbi:GNAT family N-acetyltransferase [Nocardioides sp. LHG3406-4]|uniref:GNAT family N-acetyltransferase n=1 Tax=Nocardioides sp. LHG3406-4 TaxID=2804575 RepID=UPI003CF4CCC1
MIDLALPALRYADSWIAAVREFGATTMHGSGLWDLTVDDATEATLAERIPGLLAMSDHSIQPPNGLVHSDYWWLVEGDDFVGYLAIRHALNDFLLQEGGHIGYAVRPSRRRQGHASRALGLALVRSREIGLDRVLLTCDEDNAASRRTIERNGGVYEDSRRGKRRYWIDTR